VTTTKLEVAAIGNKCNVAMTKEVIMDKDNGGCSDEGGGHILSRSRGQHE
jgi:hypothetical protein